ncbi:hypothetical protein [Finegoldia magna]|uniref:Uncharacterized protein n=1 Tax=Finegoldia magna (strain ATCC 29328 / DSM 20472 / WAL 2508) TaxID=334413 RepID=B0S4M5_FINM2|nr:hypothetical protein [Finegoldia magna]UEA71105.1 hypothetical protein LK415_09250 [Finegoldia magna]BAG09216.1 hypothetical protein FMG_P0167 [Finegoldia magna ATCC 29328]
MQDNKKTGFFEKIYKATYENMSDVKFVGYGTAILIVLAILFFFFNKNLFEIIISNLIIFGSIMTFGIRAYVNYKKDKPFLTKVLPYAMVPFIVTIVIGVFLK